MGCHLANYWKSEKQVGGTNLSFDSHPAVRPSDMTFIFQYWVPLVNRGLKWMQLMPGMGLFIFWKSSYYI